MIGCVKSTETSYSGKVSNMSNIITSDTLSLVRPPTRFVGFHAHSGFS